MWRNHKCRLQSQHKAQSKMRITITTIVLSVLCAFACALETDRISFMFSFSGPKLQICQFRACFVLVFSFLGLFRFRPSFVFGLLWFSAYPKLQQVFVSCKPSRIFCVQPLKLRRARDQGRVSHWLRRNLSKLQSCEIPFAQRLRKLAARESALSSVA